MSEVVVSSVDIKEVLNKIKTGKQPGAGSEWYKTRNMQVDVAERSMYE